MTKIKIFQTAKKSFAFLGIEQNLSMQLLPFNAKISVGLLMLILAILSNTIYISKDAETLAEYTQSIYVCSEVVLMTISLIMLIYNSSELFVIINRCERIANASEH